MRGSLADPVRSLRVRLVGSNRVPVQVHRDRGHGGSVASVAAFSGSAWVNTLRRAVFTTTAVSPSRRRYSATRSTAATEPATSSRSSRRPTARPSTTRPGRSRSPMSSTSSKGPSRPGGRLGRLAGGARYHQRGRSRAWPPRTRSTRSSASRSRATTTTPSSTTTRPSRPTCRSSTAARSQLAGLEPVANALTGTIATDQQRMEYLALPLVAVVLFLVFGGVVAAALPVIVGGLSIAGALGILRFIADLRPGALLRPAGRLADRSRYRHRLRAVYREPVPRRDR